MQKADATPQILPVEAELLGSCSYIDTVEIQQKQFFRRDAIKFFQANCGSAYGPVQKSTYGGRVVQSMSLHQPQPEVFRYLADKAAKIVYVAVALDLVTEKANQANLIQNFTVRHLLPHRVPSEAIHWVKETAYFGFKQAKGSPGVSVAVYSDHNSKATGSPCCHIEWRIKGAAKLRALKIREPEDLLTLDHSQFWSKVLRVVEVPSIESIGAAYMKAHALGKHEGNRLFPYGGRTKGIARVGSIFVRPLFENDTEVSSVNDLALHLRTRAKSFQGAPIGKLFVDLDISSWLPASRNALWSSSPRKSTT